jgi:hypothetical protein
VTSKKSMELLSVAQLKKKLLKKEFHIGKKTWFYRQHKTRKAESSEVLTTQDLFMVRSYYTSYYTERI